MNRVIIAVFIGLAILIVSGCTDDAKGVEENEEIEALKFSFDEDDFKETYEENTGKSVPVSFDMHSSSIEIDDASANQVEGFLESAHDLLGDDVIDKMYKSFKEDRSELTPGGDSGWRKVEGNDRLFLDFGILENEKYMSTIYLEVEEE